MAPAIRESPQPEFSHGLPPFRTATEQLAAMFGTPTLDGVADLLPALVFDGERSPIAAPVLVDGGAEPLVPLGSQAAIRCGNEHPFSRTLTRPDGDRTIYNHVPERNVAVSRWLVEALAQCRSLPGADR